MLLEVLQQGLSAHRLLLTNRVHETQRALRVLRERGLLPLYSNRKRTLSENFRSLPVPVVGFECWHEAETLARCDACNCFSSLFCCLYRYVAIAATGEDFVS